MTITRFYKEVLGANLKNNRWSWGAFDPVTNRIFLRLWEDQIESDGTSERIHVLWRDPTRSSPGYSERVGHLQAMKDGTKAYGVLCSAGGTTTGSRRIQSFIEDYLLELGEFSEEDGHVYSEVVHRIPTATLSRKPTAHSTLATDLSSLFSSKKFSTTEKDALVNARVGQGNFRTSVLKLWNRRCAVTGSTTLDAVRASHIKPWRESTNIERLDPYNGLPLVASLDALFDIGLITFARDGELIISSKLSEAERDIYGLTGGQLLNLPPTKTGDYLVYHYEKIFQSE